MFESSRKVQVFGSSLAMTLPALFVKVNEVEKGSVAKVFYNLEGVLVISWIDEHEIIKENIINIINKLNERIIKKDKQ